MMTTQTFDYEQPFGLENGAVLAGFRLTYSTFGRPAADGSNVIWVCHALTGSSVVTDWWPGLFGPGRLFDPEKHFVICANVLGGCYGSTGPLSTDPQTGKPYYHDFPLVTIGDMVRAMDLLRLDLGLSRIWLLMGGSLGGQQALEWAVRCPEVFDRLALLCTNAWHSPWGIAFNEAQRMAILADATWQDSHPEAGREGLKAARAIGMISYRHYDTFAKTQAEPSGEVLDGFRAATYQAYQGEKLARRFNAFTYWALSKAMDAHHVGRGRGGAEAALARVKARSLCIGILSDILFPVPEQAYIAQHIPGAVLAEMASLYGHDGFLVETEAIGRVMSGWLGDLITRL